LGMEGIYDGRREVSLLMVIQQQRHDFVIQLSWLVVHEDVMANWRRFRSSRISGEPLHATQDRLKSTKLSAREFAFNGQQHTGTSLPVQ
jgi:hypothetical protein